ncbi:MAG: hypothetical protein N2117_12910 [Anaerolineales bacterium]|nr:hypothetical protein [Anaerolineales bacterium]
MSCEGNRLKFFERVQNALGLDAKTLEKIYQTGKAAGVAAGEEQKADEKTRLLFDDMREVGIQPPTHSPDGLPKADSRAGYAAVFDYLRASAMARSIENIEDIVDDAWPLDDVNREGLNNDGVNRAGFRSHRKIKAGTTDLGNAYYESVWTGGIWGGIGSSNHVRNTLDFIILEMPFFQKFFSQADADGYMPDGYHLNGFDRNGWDESGRNIYGLSRDELLIPQQIDNAARAVVYYHVLRPNRVNSTRISLDIEGFSPEDGFRPHNGEEAFDHDRFGFDRRGFRGGRSWTGYDENGLDASGKPAPERKGYDAWGYERKTGLTAPDAQGVRYNLIGWVYDPASGDCYNPQNPSQRMKHEGSWGYSTKYKKVVLKRSYIPTEREIKARLRNPAIHLEEQRAGGYTLCVYGALNWHEAEALATRNSVVGRYLRSEERSNVVPDAHYLGIRLRCPYCGQFTGAKPHHCPNFGEKVIVTYDRNVIALRKGTYAYPESEYTDVIDETTKHGDGHIPENNPAKLFALIKQSDWRFNFTPFSTLMEYEWKKEDDETAVLLVAARSPLGENYDPDYHGGRFAGFHWKSGLDKSGRDLFGFHYLSGRRPDGIHHEDLKAAVKVRQMMAESRELLEKAGKTAKDMLEATYSRIATSIAGAPRSVRIAEEGGPRPGMFWTDMKGRIQAERYPLQNTPLSNELNNLIALKAGLYHELGHEEDTPVGVFRRVLGIANGEEEVEGLPKSAAGLVAEVYNILEDGRMERAQAKRRRGVANLLAACAAIEPRWDEQVGENIPVSHQVMGMMLYRSLPFFRVRPEVFAAAPERVRKLYLEVEPLVDRAMKSPEDAFQASIEISRKLIEADPELRQLAEKMTTEKSQGGKWAQGSGKDGGTAIIISGLPKPGAATSPDKSIPLPAPGWGRRKQDEPGAGRPQGQGKQDEPGAGRPQGQDEQDEPGAGRPQGQGKQDEPSAGRPQGQDEQDEPGAGRPDEQAERSAGSSGGMQTLDLPTPDPDDEFFTAVAASASLTALANDIAADIRYGVNSLTRTPVGRALQRPINATSGLFLEDPGNPEITHTIRTPIDDSPAAIDEIEALRNAGRDKGRQVARKLEVLKEEIHRRARLKTSGTPDRKRFKRAITGAETVYKQQEAFDITSLAVSLQLDMSGSMQKEIWSGRLAATTLALEEALKHLDAEYMVTGFGSEYAVFKTFGDPVFAPERAAAMLTTELGGTTAAPAMRLGALGLRETKSANKLHVVMTDGEFADTERAAAQAQEMRQNGIVPFGIFFGSEDRAPGDSLNQVFGEGNWVTIRSLADLPDQVGRRIEQIYRKILATK